MSISSDDVEMGNIKDNVSVILPALLRSLTKIARISSILVHLSIAHHRELLLNVHITPIKTLTVAKSESLELYLAGDMRLEVEKNTG
jgi:hypothetical protein